jgi:DNA-binding transcriptional MerR regulator
MSSQEKQTHPFYKDRADTLEDAGITAKQLRTWREAGLFAAELGPNKRKFTETDIEKLKFLKQLIVGLGLPIATVQQLVQDLPSQRSIPAGFRYLDVKSGKLVRPSTALRELIGIYANSEDFEKLEVWLLTLAARCFEQIKWAYPSAKVYEARRDELLDRLRRADLVARAEAPEDDFDEDEDGTVVVIEKPPRFVPSLSGDPDPAPDLMEQLVRERYGRLR